MKKHTKIYIDYLGYDITDFMPSEISGKKGQDIHHIVTRENRIENLMLLTREEHIKHGEIKKDMCMLLRKHLSFLEVNGVSFNYEWFNEQLKRYSMYEI